MSRPGGAAGGQAADWPLSPVEELDWYLESPGEPNVVQLETHVPGHLDRAALERALATVLAADPAMRRRLAPSPPWRRHLRWEVPAQVGDVPLSVTTWRSPDELDAVRESLAAVPIPLRERALRLILAAGPDRDALFLQAHHSAFDGISALALLSAVGDVYRELAPETGAARPSASASAAPGGNDGADVTAYPTATAMTSAPTRSRRRHGVTAVPGGMIRIARGRSGPARPGYGFAQWTAGVPRPARDGAGPHPTVNDLLVTALILTVHRWNAANGSGLNRSGGRISISVPANIRDARHRWTAPGNQTRIIRVSARPGDCADPRALLAAVSAQVSAARERPHAGLDEASRLLATGWAPAGLKRVTARLARRLAAPLATDTALVTNLGVIPAPPSFGGARPGPLWLSGPAPMPRGLGLAGLTAGDRLHLTIVYSRALFDAAGGAGFAALFRQVLGELAPPAHDQGGPAHDQGGPAHDQGGPAQPRPHPQPEREAT